LYEESKRISSMDFLLLSFVLNPFFCGIRARKIGTRILLREECSGYRAGKKSKDPCLA